MADSAAVQVFVNDHHKKCMDALIRIKKLTQYGAEQIDAAFPRASLSQIAFRGWNVVEQIDAIVKEITG